MLWLLTLLIVLIVLSVLFGGLRRGGKVGDGPAHAARVTAVHAAGRGQRA